MCRNLQVIRVLDMLYFLMHRRIGASVDELADRFGVSRKTIMRDLHALKQSPFHLERRMRGDKSVYAITTLRHES